MPSDHDQKKWRRNRDRRRIDADDAASVLAGRPVLVRVDRESDPREVRYVEVGLDRKGRLITVVWVERSGIRRLVTAWRASRNEERIYVEAQGRPAGGPG